MSIRLAEYAQTLTGIEAHCVKEFAEALEVIPLTLAENAGLNPIAVVTELRQKHADGVRTAGINVRKVGCMAGLTSYPSPYTSYGKTGLCEQLAFVARLFLLLL